MCLEKSDYFKVSLPLGSKLKNSRIFQQTSLTLTSYTLVCQAVASLNQQGFISKIDDKVVGCLFKTCTIASPVCKAEHA